MVLSASIIFTLGVVHLVYTFWGPKLTPRDSTLQISMSQISPVITKETTMCGLGWAFNASHSMGLFYSAWFSVFSHWLTTNSSPVVVPADCRAGKLGRSYCALQGLFFSVPLTGVSISLACYVASIALPRANNALLRNQNRFNE